jgi:hypothetical protein
MHETISEIFERFAREEFHNSSPLYEKLSIGIAKDPQLLSLAAQCRKGERIPNLLFAAVHYLLLKGFRHPLTRFYRSVGGRIDGREDPYPAFQSFCAQHLEIIETLVADRMVQTNEVSRCAGLMPAFFEVSKRMPNKSLYLVDIGASAGLNLFWDRYGYRYGDLQCGDDNSPVQINCVLKGNKLPPLPASFPEIAERVGLDLNPLNVQTAEDALWLQALIWPEHEARAGLLRNAIAVVREQPLNLLKGNGVDLLGHVMSRVPADSALCIVRIFTQLAREERDRLSALVSEYGRRRDVSLISFRPCGGDASEIRLTSFIDGHRTDADLAYFQNHGEWIKWLGAGLGD